METKKLLYMVTISSLFTIAFVLAALESDSNLIFISSKIAACLFLYSASRLGQYCEKKGIIRLKD